jgi:hypothetical protein
VCVFFCGGEGLWCGCVLLTPVITYSTILTPVITYSTILSNSYAGVMALDPVQEMALYPCSFAFSCHVMCSLHCHGPSSYLYNLPVVNTIRIDHQDISFTTEDSDEGEGNCEELHGDYIRCVWRGMGYGVGVSFWCLLTLFSPMCFHEKMYH